MTSRRNPRRQQLADKLEDSSLAALEHELNPKPAVQRRAEERAAERTAAHAEAAGFARVTGKHVRSRPSMGGDAA